MHKYLSVLALAGCCLAATPGQSQSLGNSPYSRFGIGEMNTNQGNIRNFSMGGTGVSAPNGSQLNDLNPALLYYNNNVIFELSAASQLKNLKQEDRSQRDGSVTLNSLGLGIPVSKRWTAAAGLRPYSTVQYESNTTQPVAGDPSLTTAVKYSGEGTLSEVYFGNGVKLFKDLTLGASGSYVFGTLSNRYTTSLTGTNFQQVQISEETRVYDFVVKAGAAYRLKVAGKYNLGLGGFYNFGADLDAKRRTVVERLSTTSLNRDLQSDSTTGTIKMPASFQAGINLDNGTNWNVNLDVAAQQWDNFRSYDGIAELQNSMRVGLGGEYVPEPASSNYFRRITYRAGLRYGQTPYQFAGEQLKESALTWGFTFPVGRALITESYFLNLGFALGKRGTTSNQLVQENFIKVQAGISLSNKWFIQRKLE